MMPPNRKAFLDMIAVSEGTSTCPQTMDRGYDVIVMGIDKRPELFVDYRQHPFANGRAPKVINSNGLTSTASGRYQFLVRDWLHYKALCHLPDFGPDSQDAWAIQLIRERGALPLIDIGNFKIAVQRCNNLWASLPGAGYGQHENDLAALESVYVDSGGTVAA